MEWEELELLPFVGKELDMELVDMEPLDMLLDIIPAMEEVLLEELLQWELFQEQWEELESTLLKQQ